MNTAELQSELHQVIDQINDHAILKAIHTILSSQTKGFAYTTDGTSLTKSEFDQLLEASEAEILRGETIDHTDLKGEIESWRKK